jgi:calcineurin-like phosphoesterase family protein
MNIYHWSDPHFGHERLIDYVNSPFKNIKEKDSTIINNFNSKVKEDDFCICYGDFCFGKSNEAPNSQKKAFEYYRNQLKCKNIIFIRGSHDKNNGVKTPIRSLVITMGGKWINCVHNPKEARGDFFFNFCGHWHGKYGKFIKLTDKSTIVDLSVENWDYFPIEYNEIWQGYSMWLKKNKNE